MGLFDSLGQQPARQNQGQQMPSEEQMQMMRQDVSEIKANPVSYLSARGYTIPDGMTDAKQITQHLLRTGQIGNQRLQQVMGMLGRR